MRVGADRRADALRRRRLAAPRGARGDRVRGPRAAAQRTSSPQVTRFADWRELAPERAGLSGPEGARVPFVDTHEIDGQLVLADSLDRVDLLAAIDDSVFARPGSEDLTVGPSRKTRAAARGDGGPPLRAGVASTAGRRGTFLVDTGAGHDRDLAPARRHARPRARRGDEPGRARRRHRRPRRPICARVGLGALERQDVSCFVLDFAALLRVQGLDVDGILGFSALNRYAVTFDFEHGALELARTPAALARARAARACRCRCSAGSRSSTGAWTAARRRRLVTEI